MRKLTIALRSGNVDCPSSVACHTLRGAVHEAIQTGWRHAVIACARIHYKRTMQKKESLLLCSCTHTDTRTLTSTRGFVVIYGPPGAA